MRNFLFGRSLPILKCKFPFERYWLSLLIFNCFSSCQKCSSLAYLGIYDWLSYIVKILGSESFTRWLVWGTSARKLGKIGKFLHPHHLWVPKIKIFLPSIGVWVSPPPHIVSTTEAALLYKQNTNSEVPATSQNFGAKNPKVTTKVTLTSHQRCSLCYEDKIRTK